MLSVYTRHHPDCKYAGDKRRRRCNCPKWIWGSLDGRFLRQSAKTHSWEQAEEFRQRLQENAAHSCDHALGVSLELSHPTEPTPPPAASIQIFPLAPQKTRVTIKRSVEAYLADARSRELEVSTLSKLDTIFRKQFLAWTEVQGFEYLDQLDLDALLSFRETWKDGRLAKQKKQSRLIGFFWAAVRRGYLAQNPCMGLGKIKVVQITYGRI